MDAFTIEIAGLVTRVQPLFVSTRDYCGSYLSDLEPEFYVTVTESDLMYEQKVLDEEALEEGLRRRIFSGPFLERATIQRKIAVELLNRSTILLHGSTVAVDGAAYLFTAPCGTGKSTHTRLWRDVFGERAVMVNDDKAFLKILPDGVLAYGSPWSGKHGLDTNCCFPLKGICFLRRGAANRMERVEPVHCLEELYRQTMIPDDADGKRNAFRLVSALSGRVGLWRMECTKDPEAARISYGSMSGMH